MSNDAEHRGIADAEAHARRHALRMFAAANGRLKEPVADGKCKDVAVLLRQQSMHHVEGRSATRASQTVAINFEEAAAQIQIWKLFLETWRQFPVQCEAVAFQQPRPCEHIGARGNASHVHALPR